jgi:OOP family OmpA-OmpF porin
VRLTGTVPTVATRAALVDLVGAAVGKRQVVDETTIDPAAPLPSSIPLRLYAPILFGPDRAASSRDHWTSVRRCAALLRKAPASTVTVVGYTDDRGSVAYNDALGLARAQVVTRMLVSTGIPARRVRSESKGPRDPIADNATLAGRRQNRRVEFVVTNLLTVG